MLQCQHCRHTHDAGARFCVACGKPLGAPAPSSPETPSPSRIDPSVLGAASARVTPTPPPTPQSHRVVAPDSGSISTSRLPFAETAPPLLDEDLQNRRIADRGARHRIATPGAPHGRATGTAPMSITESLDVPTGAPRVLVGFLVSYDGNPLGQSWPIHQGQNMVGRLGALAGADIELPHATVSHQHALIRAAAHPHRVQIVARPTTNGTCVNDTILQPEQQRMLTDGDRLSFGLFKLVVKII